MEKNVLAPGILLILFLFILAGCMTETAPPVPEQEEKAAEQILIIEEMKREGLVAEEQEQTQVQTEKAISSTGAFHLSYGQDTGYSGLATAFRNAGLFEEHVAFLNENIRIPTDVTIALKTCDALDAFYDKEKKEVSICYDLIDDVANIFAAYSEEEEDADEPTTLTLLFVFYHEVAHALMDVLELEVSEGIIEDAADRLALSLLFSLEETGEYAILSALDYFELKKQEEEIGQRGFYQKHGFNDERRAYLICAVYGKNPEKYVPFLADGDLDAEDAALCPDEYRKIVEDQTITLHLTQPAAP